VATSVTADTAGRLDLFLASLERRRASGELRPRAEVADAAAARLVGWGAQRAIVASDPWLDDLGVPEALAGAGLEVLRWPAEGVGWRELVGLVGPGVTCGVTVPTAAVAERGTLVLEAGPGHGRSLDVACTYHLAVMPEDRVLGTLHDALVGAFRRGGRPSSAVSLVSGPSRTSDIEKISTLGAHGAVGEHVVIVGGP
jgi:L-lactate utilization protein LutC